jgi:tripartite-type tricarboxylate transporter receptor subunit TctC
MRLTRRFFALFLLAFAAAAAADTFPSKPIRLVLPFAPGGASDALARLLAPRLSEALGQPILVDNRPGAGGNVAALAVLGTPADGYTVLMASSMLTTNKFLYKKLSYDPEKDFAPVAHLGGGPYVLVAHPSLPAANLGDLLSLSKTKPLFYASSGIGGGSHLAGELLKMQTGLRMTHTPFRGGGPAAVAVLAGEPPLLFGTIASSAAHIKSGTLRAIGVTGATRAPQLPSVPTLDELGAKGFDVTTWDALVVPAATPKPVVERLSAAVMKVLRLPEVAAQVRQMGYTPTGSTPEELGSLLKAETAVWARVIREADIQAE